MSEERTLMVRNPLTGELLAGFSYPENQWPSPSPVPVWTNNPERAAKYDQQQAEWAAKEILDHMAKADPLGYVLSSIMLG